MMRILLAALAALVAALILGPVVIPILRRMKFGQTIYELGPESHKKKQGTPTMGGVIFALPAIIAALCFAHNDARWGFLLIALVCCAGFGAIGFVDDFIKVKLKRSLGLTVAQKLVPQVVLSIALAAWAYAHKDIGSTLIVPFVHTEWNLGWAYIPVMAFILVGTTNSANLLDGMDGLLSGCSAIEFGAMAVITALLAVAHPELTSEYNNLAIFAAAMVGALLGFLRVNCYPAMVFMGDVGSFIIGGALSGIMLTTRLALYLPIIALPMFASSVSDILQIGYFKLTHGKRIFRMAPLHHHFELGGMPETRVVYMYYIVNALMCLLALLAFAH